MRRRLCLLFWLWRNATRGCAGEGKKAFAVSFERSGMVFNTQKLQHIMGGIPFTGGGASDAGDRVFSASC